MEVMTRQQARDAGLTRYFTGKPCKHGHIAERRMSDGCVVCADLYARTWQKAHPEYVKAKSLAYHKENSEMLNAKNRKWRAENPDKHRAATESWRLRNTEQMKAMKAAWKKRNMTRVLAQNAFYRAAKLKATPAWASQAKIEEFYETVEGLGMLLGERYHVDHIVPLQHERVCGLHVEHNLQILSAFDNISKRNRHWPDM